MLWLPLVIIAVIFVTIENVVEKKTLSVARTLEFTTIFSLFNVVVTLPFIFLADFTNVNLYIISLIFLSALPSAGASLLMFKSLKHNELSESAPIFSLLPLFVTFLAFVFLGEKTSLIQFCGILVILFGITILELNNFKNHEGVFRSGRGKYLSFIIGGLILAGISAIIDRVILNKFNLNVSTYLVFTHFFIALIFIIYYLYTSHLENEFVINIKKYWIIISLISLMTVFHRYLYVSAVQLGPSMGVVVAVYKLSDLTSVLAGGKFFSEGDILRKIIASFIIVSGIILLST